MNKGILCKENGTLSSFCDIEDVKDVIGRNLLEAAPDSYCIAVYAKRDLINELFVSLISDGYIFSYADFDNLDDMVKDTIYLMMIMDDCRVSIEPAISDSGIVIMHDADKVLIYADDCEDKCGKRIIDYCVNEDMNITYFDLDGNDKCEINETDECSYKENQSIAETINIIRNDNGNPEGFTKSLFHKVGNGSYCTSYSYYDNDVETLKKVADEFGIKI